MAKAMRRWRDFRTGITHAFDPNQHIQKHPHGAVLMFCHEELRLRCSWGGFSWALITQVPSGKRLTDELLSVKAQVTCLGCLGES